MEQDSTIMSQQSHTLHPNPMLPYSSMPLSPGDPLKKSLTIDTNMSSNGIPFFLPSPRDILSGSAAALLKATSPRKIRSNYSTLNGDGPTFGPVRPLISLFNADRSQSIRLDLNAQVDKGFFLAEGDWACYRRNYFQVTVSFSRLFNSPTLATPQRVLGEHEACYMDLNGKLVHVEYFSVTVRSRFASGDKPVDLVQNSSKRDKESQKSPLPRRIRPTSLDAVGLAQHVGDNLITFERLQFKSATPNNGKRRATQQHFVVDVILKAHCLPNIDQGDNTVVEVPCAVVSTCPLVVRGRSPGHYNHQSDVSPTRHMTIKTAGISMPSGLSAPGFTPNPYSAPLLNGPTSADPFMHSAGSSSSSNSSMIKSAYPFSSSMVPELKPSSVTPDDTMFADAAAGLTSLLTATGLNASPDRYMPVQQNPSPQYQQTFFSSSDQAMNGGGFFGGHAHNPMSGVWPFSSASNEQTGTQPPQPLFPSLNGVGSSFV